MKTRSSHSEYAQLEQMAVSGRGLLHSLSAREQAEATRRQKKHDLLLTFMANAKAQKRRAKPARPKLISALLSIFF